MEETLQNIAQWISTALQGVGVLVITVGSLQGFFRILIDIAKGMLTTGFQRKIWVDYGVWLMMGLQFLLAADIVRSAVAPTWNNIGQLAAIAAIRTFLSFFLERDISEFWKNRAAGKTVAPAKTSQ